MYIHVQVTEADIAQARIECPTSPGPLGTCPISKALLRLGVIDPIVDNFGYITWAVGSDSLYARERMLIPPDIVLPFVEAYNNNEPVEPISFTINESDCIRYIGKYIKLKTPFYIQCNNHTDDHVDCIKSHSYGDESTFDE